MANPLPKSPNYLRGAYGVAARQVGVFKNFKVPPNLTYYLGVNKGAGTGTSGGSGSLTPPLTNLFAWYKSSSLALSNGAPLVSWADSSGNGRNMIPDVFNAPVYQTNILNGKPGVKFSGGTDGLTNVATFSSTAYSIYIVHKQTSASGDAGTLVGLSATVNGFMFMKLTGNKTIVNRGVASLVDGAASTNAELWSIIRTAAPLTTLRINNGNAVALTNDTAADGGINSGIYLGVFGATPGFNLDGHLFEVLMYSAAHDAANLAAVRAYISQEWAIF